MMKSQPFLVLGVMSLLATAALAVEPAFQFSRAVQLPALEQEELVLVKLDASVYEATQDGLEDLRLLDNSGQPLPFLVRQSKSSRIETIRQTWTAKTMTARPLEDGGLEITVVLDRDDPAPNGLKLVTPLDNFEKRLRLQTSPDGQQWQEALESPIFDYSRYVDVRQDSVSFPKTNHRHIRILIDNVTATQESELLELTRRLKGTEETNRQERVTLERRPFRIDRIEFWNDVPREVPEWNVKETYPVDSFRVEQDADAKQTHVLIDMRREPLTALSIETPERNFSRRAIVEFEEVDGIQRSWKRVGEGTLTRIDFKDLKREQLSINFRETRNRRLRIVIENRDSPPLAITGITATGNLHEIIFLASSEQSLRLVYGDAEAKPAEYDTAALRELLQAGYVPRTAEMGSPEPHTALDGTGETRWPAILSNRMFVLAMIAILVIVLGLGLYRAARRVDAAHPEPPPKSP